MKETFYFTHDYNARQDSKIKNLLRRHGVIAYGVYWAIIEDLYQNANALPTDYECIAFDLRTSEEMVKSIVNDFDLFIIKDGLFGSLSVQRRIDERDAKSKKARDSAFARWNKDANALPTQSDGNAIKEKKGKENKEKENKEVIPTLEEFLNYLETEMPNWGFDFNSYKFSLTSKYETWVGDNWKDGNGTKIKNWKTKIKNVIPYLPKPSFNKPSQPSQMRSLDHLANGN